MNRIKEDIKKIADDPLSFWLGGGDYSDAISVTDRRFDPDCVSENITVKDLGRLGLALNEQVRDLFKPIAHKCLGLLEGNHELVYERTKEQHDRHSWLCQELGVPNLGYCCLMDVVLLRGKEPELLRKYGENMHGKVTGSTYRIFSHHGAGAAQTPGGKLNRLTQFMDSFDADIYFVHHVHDQVGKRIVVLSANESCNKIVEREKLGIISGSYLRTYTQGCIGYGEQKGYRPVPIGARFAKIHPESKRLEGTI